ncbi:MAG TPA: YheC/YheD family protein [Bacillota bacterium]|nr:YheC/YheD family protein [Bacillota bacterium]
MAYLSLGADHTWILHISPNLYHKTQKKSSLLKVGAKEINWRTKLSMKFPEPNSLFTKVKLTTKKGALFAGPFLGILTVSRGADFKGNKNNFIDIIQAAKEFGAFVFVFTVEEINWNTGTTGAFFYHEGKKEWIHLKDLPLPNVVYNRIPYREDEQKQYVHNALNRLQNIPELHLYNSQFFNKWALYGVLSRNPNVSKWIPESRLLNSLEDLEQLAKVHRLLYLKPIEGKAGIGIMSIIHKQDSYLLKIPSQQRTLTHRFSTIDSLWKYLKPRLIENYIVQQGVSLLTHKDCRFDIRVLIQKDENGLWQLSGVGIRVAGRGGITTHVPRGGSIASPEEVLLPHLGQDGYEQKMKELKMTVLEIANALSEHDPSLGEMSMDIGLTKEGRFWFFEANAKPMKFDEPPIRRTSLKRIIQYAQYLSDFTTKGEMQGAGQTGHTRAVTKG